MYVPPAFAESDAEVLAAFVDAHPLGALVTADDAHGLHATHLPLVLHREGPGAGVLRGHVARANAHARADGRAAVVIFAGADAYVHPGWYPSKAEHGRVVPTWNYAAVHAHGTLRVVDDAAWLRAHVESLTARHEAGRPRPWAVDDAPAEYVERMLREVVGIELAVSRLDGKWKMSQNRAAPDIAGVIAGLAASDRAGDRAAAAVVAERRPRSKR
ncbi:FMN-binding negative transcriptional regulator [Roseisolibacter sp. H3M3-2]|uniref:FMN-binding negative transcriptional regulator n=1 Tax=Roseisolibacter sp. H3M3-2 TaxID=3031323 RepID=UPI0023DC3761|nr:FMN-binding negative transcriptional regulator [Roseisolibacter sp. H3M3-2]MDF1506107.1 FMN-binding negative transcriptional regulator [Roseisolibacter sp. H3M3-2]